MAVVLSDDCRKVLLLRREIFILWDLPGGGVEAGESPGEAAVRECFEETGYQVSLGRQVGTYRHQSVYGIGDQLTHAFRARATGGSPRHWGLETTGLRWCAVEELPRGLQPLHRQMIIDALPESASPVERSIRFSPWLLYPARVAFNVMRLVNNTLRLFFPKS